MNKEILLVAEAVSNEKGVSRDIIFEAIEQALATATKKRYDEDSDIQVNIDRETGDYETFRRWEVVSDDELALLGTQFTTEEAAEKDASLQVGDVYQEQVENVGFGRIAAQTAKQVIVQKVREAERAQVVEEYEGRAGELISGTVKKLPVTILSLIWVITLKALCPVKSWLGVKCSVWVIVCGPFCRIFVPGSPWPAVVFEPRLF